MPQNRSTAPNVVTAVLVAHDGARWLPDTLEAVQKQTRPVDRVVAADNGSRDRGPALLNDALGPDRITALDRSTGYGAAIAAALRLPAASAPVPPDPAATPGEPAVEWIWLLHDDCAPDPYALEQLLRTSVRDPRAMVIGPKVRDWHDHRVLLEAGVTIDRAGRRETGLEPREFDQGQRDGDREVLAVGSAGMLVRRDVWDALGGFDPGIALFRDDIDFCWRAGGAGHKVLVTTTAVVYHAEASARRRRRITASRKGGDAKRPSDRGKHPQRIDRRNALYVLFANLPFGALLVAMVRALFGSLLRTLLFLLAKQPGSAVDELAAIAHVYGRPLRMLVARRRRAKNRRRSYSAIRPYMARGLAAARLAAMIGGVFGGAAPMGSAGQHHAGALDSDDEDAELLADTRGPLWRVLSNPGVLLFLALTVVTLAAERSLLGGGLLGGGALVPVTGGASGLWRQYLAGWHPVGLGSGDPAPPATAVLAAVATVLGGKVSLAVALLLLGCVPLAGLVVYFATRRIVAYRPARVWLAASYALLPVATGAIAAGRLGTAVAIVVIPVIGVYFANMLSRRGSAARRAAWAAGVLLAVAMAFVPLVWVLVAVVGGLVAVAFGGGRATGGQEQRGLLINVGVVVLTPPLLLGPWAWALFAHPSRFLLEAGLHRPGLADPALSARSLLLLSPGGPGMPPVWMTGGFLLAGLAALCLRRHRVLVAAGWGVTLFGLLVAILVSRATPAPPTGGPGVAAWPGVALGVAASGLLLAAATAAGTIVDLIRRGGWRRAAGFAVVVLACSSPVLVAGAWVVNGVDGPLTRYSDDVMPPAVAALSGNRTGTLVVRPDRGGVSYTVLRGTAPLFGDDQLRPPDEARVRLDALVSGLMSGRGGDDGHALVQYGIRFVLVPAPVDTASLHRLDGVPGMSRMTLTSDYAVWRVTGPTARVRITAPDGGVTAVPGAPVGVPDAAIPAGRAGRVLELAEPADSAWSATLNGHDLTPRTVHGWAQGFELPASGGRLVVARGTFWHTAFLWAQGAALLVVLVLALPGAGREEDAEAEGAGTARPSRLPRPSRKDHRPRHQPRRARGHRRAVPEDEPGEARSLAAAETRGLAAAEARADAGAPEAGRDVPPASWGRGDVPTGRSGLGDLVREAPYGRPAGLPAATGERVAGDAGYDRPPGAETRPGERVPGDGGYGRPAGAPAGTGPGERVPGESGYGRPGRRDPLAGTPLSRDTPVDTSEIPTPLAESRPHEGPPSGGWRAEGAHDAGPSQGSWAFEPRTPVEPRTEPPTGGFAFRTAWEDEAPPARPERRESVADGMVSGEDDEPAKDEHAGRPW
ncbi:MAG TPA: glycosyltransferase [Streptosporangiaceae bacterium]